MISVKEAYMIAMKFKPQTDFDEFDYLSGIGRYENGTYIFAFSKGESTGKPTTGGLNIFVDGESGKAFQSTWLDYGLAGNKITKHYVREDVLG